MFQILDHIPDLLQQLKAQGLRSGTLPLPLVVGFAKAIEIAVSNQKNNAEKLLFYRNNLLELSLIHISEPTRPC